MVANLLLRGMIVGLIAGVLAFGFARFFGEPLVDRAIAFEESGSDDAADAHAAGAAGGGHAHSHGHGAEQEVVSRSTQAGIGLFTGIAVYGMAMGGLTALVFAFVQGRFSQQRPRLTVGLIALGALVAIIIVPGLKYPANPPAVGNADTIQFRTGLYFMMLALSLIAAVVAIAIARSLWERRGAWTALITAAAAYLVMMVIAQLALPAINEVPEAFSASLLWNFRVASLGIQIILWTTIGLLFGALAERKLQPPRRGARLRA